jgi:hypothetical protein
MKKQVLQLLLSFLSFHVLPLSAMERDNQNNDTNRMTTLVSASATLEDAIGILSNLHELRSPISTPSAPSSISTEIQNSAAISKKSKKQECIKQLVEWSTPISASILDDYGKRKIETCDPDTLKKMFSTLGWARLLTKLKQTQEHSEPSTLGSTTAISNDSLDDQEQEYPKLPRKEKKTKKLKTKPDKQSTMLSDITKQRRAIRDALTLKNEYSGFFSDDEDNIISKNLVEKAGELYERAKRRHTTITNCMSQLQQIEAEIKKSQELKKVTETALSSMRAYYESECNKRDAELSSYTGPASEKPIKQARFEAWKLSEKARQAGQEVLIEKLGEKIETLSTSKTPIQQQLTYVHTTIYLNRKALKHIRAETAEKLETLQGAIRLLEQELTQKETVLKTSQSSLTQTTLENDILVKRTELAEKKKECFQLEQLQKDLPAKISGIELPRSTTREFLKYWGIIS